MTCPICGHKNDSEAEFCVACGQRLRAYAYEPAPAAQPQKTEPVDAFSAKSQAVHGSSGKRKPLNINYLTLPLLLGLLFIALGMYFVEVGTEPEEPMLLLPGAALFFLGMISALWGQIYWYIILYRSWSILSPMVARTTPGKAVGFLFIPIFNFFWVFMAVWGLAQDAQRSGLREPLPNPSLALTFCVMHVIPYVNLFSIFLMIPVAHQFCRFYNVNTGFESW